MLSNAINPADDIPAQFNLSIPPSRDHQILRRDDVKRSFDGGVSTPHYENEVLTVSIPASDKCCAPMSFYFSADMKFLAANKTDANVNTAEIRGSVRRLFSKLKIETLNGAVIEEIDDVNLIEELISAVKYGSDYQARVMQLEGLFDSRREAPALLASNEEKYRWSKQIDTTAVTDTSASDQKGAVMAFGRLTNPDVAGGPPGAGGLVADTGAAAANHVRTKYGDWLAQTVAGVKVVWRFDCSGFLNLRQFLPLNLLGGLKISLTTAPQAIATHSRDGTGYQRLSNIHVHYQLVTLSPAMMDTLVAAHSAGALRVYFDSWLSRFQAGVQNMSFEINKSVNQLKNVCVTTRLTASLVATENSFASTSADFQDVQLRWNDIQYPQDKIDSVHIAYYEFLKALKADPALGSSDVPSLDEYKSRYFMLLWNLETLPYEDSWTAVSTKGQKPVIVNLNLANTNYRANFLAQYTKIIEFNPDDSVTVLE